MNRPNLREMVLGILVGTALFGAVCIAFQGLIYTPKDTQTDKPYFVYQGY